MENKNTRNTEEQEPKKTEMAATEAVTQEPEKMSDSKFTIDYALEMIEKIVKQGDDLTGLLSSMSEDAAHAVLAREETNRKLIDFYQRIIDDLKKPRYADDSEKERFYQFVKECVANTGPNGSIPDFAKLAREVL